MIPSAFDYERATSVSDALAKLAATDGAGKLVAGGHSLVPLMKGETPADWRNSFYYHYYEFPGAHSVARHYGVTDSNYKLIHFYQNKEWEMFDLTADPNELQSLYGRGEYAVVQARLEKELHRLRDHYKLPAEDPPSARPQQRRRK